MSTRSILARLPSELAGEDRVAAVDREVGVVDAGALRHRQRALHLHRLRVAEVEPLARLGDHDRRLARPARSTCCTDRPPGSSSPACRSSGSIGVRVPSVRPSALLVTHSVFRSHEGTTCCGLIPTRNLSTTLHGGRVDDVHVVRLAVRHVDALQRAGDRGAQLARGASRCKGCADRPPAACRGRFRPGAAAPRPRRPRGRARGRDEQIHAALRGPR